MLVIQQEAGNPSIRQVENVALIIRLARGHPSWVGKTQ